MVKDFHDKVTVIIPVYNTSHYLRQCVDSVLGQSYKNLEVLLVDDGSTDNSADICDEYCDKYKIVKVIHKKNEGLGITRNRGLENATGKYVTFLDSDDWITPNHIERLVSASVENDSDIVIGSRTRFDDCSEQKEELSLYGLYQGKEIKEKVLPELIAASPKAKLDLGLPMSVCFSLYKVNYIKRLNLEFPSERYCVSEDFFFNYKYLLHANKVTLIDEYGYMYRKTPNSITQSFDQVQIERVYNFYKEIKRMVIKPNIDSELESRVYRCSLAILRGLLKRLVSSSLNSRDKKKFIKMILNDSRTKEMIRMYDYKNYNIGLRIFTISMKYKCVFMIYSILKIKNSI